MKLSDAVSAMNLSVFAEVPLLIFMGVFLGACLHVLRGGRRLEGVAQLPLRSEGSRRSER